MALTLLTLSHPETATDMANILQAQSGNTFLEMNLLQNYLGAVLQKARRANLKVSVGSVQATGTFTLATAVATNTVVINGVTFTAIASGATGNQFNVGADDTATAVNLAAAINASVTAKVSGYVTATSSGAVVTVTAVQPGLSGNMFTTTATGAITAGASALAGGTAGTEVTYAYSY